MGFQNIGPNYWKGEEGRKALIAGTAEVHRPALCRDLRGARNLGALYGRRLPGAEISRQRRTSSPSARPRSIRPARGTSPIFSKQADFEFGAFPPPVAKAGDTCYISDHTDIAHRHQRQVEERRSGQDLPVLGGLARIRRRSTPTRCPASSRSPTRKSTSRTRSRHEFVELARHLQVYDPQLLPDPVARHAEPRERALERDRPGDERHHEAGGRGQAGPGRPRQLVQAAQEVSFAMTRARAARPASSPLLCSLRVSGQHARISRPRGVQRADAIRGPFAAFPSHIVGLPRAGACDLHASSRSTR